MNCYKCGTEDNLSIKSQRKETGYKLMICKSCRNKYHHENKHRWYNTIKPNKTWEELAAESRRRLALR